ncbi:MAG: putative Mg2+ transporter-C (MgtC) family protein [Parcubacteria group bacterium LiPW_15]|nr:MAG: putative Mg2+ transporter-C (MgtC) family protein [Parcubacteria group bacterium LiPW_15]
MLTFSQLILRLVIAMALGALMGLEREVIGKEAGIRTAMMVAGGAAIFTMISIMIPFMSQLPVEELKNTLPDRVISNIVVGIGFLGAGIIIKNGEHVRGLTTAALIWAAAAIGTLVGLNLIKFAVVAAVIMSGSLYILRKLDVTERVRPESSKHQKAS